MLSQVGSWNSRRRIRDHVFSVYFLQKYWNLYNTLHILHWSDVPVMVKKMKAFISSYQNWSVIIFWNMAMNEWPRPAEISRSGQPHHIKDNPANWANKPLKPKARKCSQTSHEWFDKVARDITANHKTQQFKTIVSWGLFWPSSLFVTLETKKGTGAEIRPAVVFGIVTGDTPSL